MFASIYQSPWHHPGLAFLLGGLGILLVVWLRPWDTSPARRSFALLFALLELEILVDATLTGALSPLPATSLGAMIAAIVFVILGDLRYFYLVERQRDDAEASRGRALGAAAMYAMILPLATGLGRLLFPGLFEGNRLFLAYEIGFLFLAIGHFGFRGELRGRSLAARAYVRRLFAFELTQYALWAVADVLILGGIDAGWALRIAPNVLYYAGFAPFAVLAAPEEARP